MNILIINITLDWVYNLYSEYINSFKEFIELHYQNINVNILFFDEKVFTISLLKNINKYDKLFFSGNINIIKNFINIHSSTYFINIEQLSNQSYYLQLRELDRNTKVIDYSEENILYIKDSYQHFLFPPYFKYNSTISQDNKDIDVLFILNNQYRQNIYNNIIFKENYNIIHINEIFGNTRDNYFDKTKIYINIHCSNEHKTMELIRIHNLIMRKVIIISQNSALNELLFFKKYIFICNDEKYIPTFVDEILDNYDFYYNELFGDFDEKEYIEYVKKNCDKIINS